MSGAFTVANDYRQKFEPYRAFYEENEELDVEKLTEEDHGEERGGARGVARGQLG